MEKGEWERGRHAFPLADGYRDYSGQDLRALYLAHSDALSHAFLNGASIEDCRFVEAKIDHCELAESIVTESAFSACDLSMSDLVRASFTKVAFEKCDFSNGEWRQAKFEDVTFQDCIFSHTTINLCSFIRCSFFGDGSAALDHRSVNYNTFSQCSFQYKASDRLVVSRNFGLPGVSVASSIVELQSGITLEQVCVSSSSGDVTVADLASAIENECTSPHSRLKKTRLEFISNIVSLLAHAQKISPGSLIYIENIFSGLAKAATNETDFLAAMNALVNVRNSLYEAAKLIDGQMSSETQTCYEISLKFKSTFSVNAVRAFVKALSEVIFEASENIVLESVRPGSTIVECTFSVIATIGSVLAGLNLLLAQANTTVQRVVKLRNALKRLPATKVNAKRAPRKAAAIEKVPAILNPGAALPQLIPLRAAIDREGRILLHFDEVAAVTVATAELAKGAKRRRQKV